MVYTLPKNRTGCTVRKMATEKKMLEVRAQNKKRKPTYRRVQSKQFPKLSKTTWRRPKGMDNKVRLGRRGQLTKPEVGYGSPKEVRAFNKEGYKEVLVHTLSDLGKVGEREALVLGATVGRKKRIAILEEAAKKKLIVAGVKSVSEYITSLKERKKKESKAKKSLAEKAKEAEKKKADTAKSEKEAEKKKESPEKKESQVKDETKQEKQNSKKKEEAKK